MEITKLKASPEFESYYIQILVETQQEEEHWESIAKMQYTIPSAMEKDETLTPDSYDLKLITKMLKVLQVTINGELK